MSLITPPNPGNNHGQSAPPQSLLCPYCQVPIPVTPQDAGRTICCLKCGGRMVDPRPPQISAGYQHGYLYGQQTDAYAIQAFAQKKIAAGICGILLGGMGIHKFILGFPVSGTVMLLVWLFGVITGSCLILPLFASMAMGIIGLIEGILYLTKTDEEFFYTYVIQRKEWF